MKNLLKKSFCVYFLLFGCFVLIIIKNRFSKGKNTVYSESRPLMGTIATITVYGIEEKKAKEVIDSAFKAMEKIEKLCSRFLPESDVSRINKSSGILPVPVSDETFEIVEKSIFYSKLTDGAFDITIAPIVELWQIGKKSQRIPSDSEIADTLNLVSYKEVLLNPQRKTIFLKKKGMKIDLGGVAKGYANDQAISTLKKFGVKQALIDFGGQISVLGKPHNKKNWRIGIQHPRELNRTIAAIEIKSGSVATSGDYMRYFTGADGIRYHHIFDPKTGKPAKSGCSSVTVVAPDGITADILSTSIFVLGPNKGLALVEKLPNVECLIVKEEGGIVTSSKLKFFSF